MFHFEEPWSLDWDKELIRTSYPPCIAVRVKGEFVEMFQSLAREICPDVSFLGFNRYDKEEIPQPEETINQQKREDLEKKEEALSKLLATGFIYT